MKGFFLFLYAFSVKTFPYSTPQQNLKTKKRRRKTMFGLNDASIILAYLCCAGGALLCVIYGIVNWNKNDESEKGGKGK